MGNKIVLLYYIANVVAKTNWCSDIFAGGMLLLYSLIADVARVTKFSASSTVSKTTTKVNE